MRVACFTAAAASLLLSAVADVPADEVTALPGWSKPLPSKQWSGYLTVGKEKSRHLHYYFVASEGDPTTDPVTLWLNGTYTCQHL